MNESNNNIHIIADCIKIGETGKLSIGETKPIIKDKIIIE